MNKIIFTLVVALLFGACSNRFSVVKRKYNKGFYVSSSKKNKLSQFADDSKTINSKKAIEKNESEVVIVDSKKSEPILVSSLNSENDVENYENLSLNSHQTVYTASAKTNNITQKHKEFKTIIKALKQNKLIEKNNAIQDTNTLILVILSLFPVLCLIAVYLKDGKSITMNFWVDLLLHITVIGEVIFALLVVLGIVSLA